MKNNFYIYVDDIRNCPFNIQENYVTFTCRDYAAAIEVIDYCISFKDAEVYLDLDHDLGEEKSGYDIAKYIVENRISITSYKVHSMNSVGTWNIHQLMEHYGYRRFEA